MAKGERSRGPLQALLTAEQAAPYLGVEASWLEKRAAAGTIPCTYVGRYLRFHPDHIQEIQERGEVRPVVERRAGCRCRCRCRRGAGAGP